MSDAAPGIAVDGPPRTIKMTWLERAKLARSARDLEQAKELVAACEKSHDAALAHPLVRLDIDPKYRYRVVEDKEGRPIELELHDDLAP